METKTLVSCTMIFLGAIIMLLSIIKSFMLMRSVLFFPVQHKKSLNLYHFVHIALMVFFLVGYLVVAAAFGFGIDVVSELFVSLIFFFGAIFVLIGIDVQTRLLKQMQTTLQGILPICAKCKKIKSDQGQETPEWKEVEEYVATKADVMFSHGYCPTCYEEEMKKIESR